MLVEVANDALDRLVKLAGEVPDEEELDLEEMVKKVKEQLKTALTKPEVVAEKKKAKVAKDEDAPKRAVTSFMLYSNEVRPKVRKDFPELKITEVAKKISEMWNALSDDEKKPYTEKANKDKERYEREKKAYKPKN